MSRSVFGEQADVFGEHGEQAAHEELRDIVRVVFVGFERFGEFGELCGDFAGDFGAAAGRVERERIGPDRRGGVRECFRRRGAASLMRWFADRGRDVGAAGLGELGVEIDRVADIDDDEERRAGFVGGECAGVLLGLAAGAEEGVVPGGGAAGAVAFLAALLALWRGVGEEAASSSCFSMPCLVSRTKQPRL